MVVKFKSDNGVLGIKLTEEDLAHYENFPVVVSSRWQQEVLETVWNVVNNDRDREDEGKGNISMQKNSRMSFWTFTPLSFNRYKTQSILYL